MALLGSEIMRSFTVEGRWVTVAVVVSCAICFLIDTALQYNAYSKYALYYWESAHAKPWQYVSHLFLHGDIFHLLLNMFCLWIFGSAVERMIGSLQYAAFYLLCGIGAALVYQLVTFYEFSAAIEPLLQAGIHRERLWNVFANQQYYPQFPTSEVAIELFLRPVVGASGALYGVLVAFACLCPRHRMVFLLLPYPLPAKVLVPLLLLIDVAAGFSGISLLGQNIAHAAHIGGALTGLLVILLWYSLRALHVTITRD